MSKNFIKISKILFLFLLLFFVSNFFLEVNKSNYIQLKEIKSKIIDHPEKLPKKEFVKASSFWFENIRADMLWLETIQYIWWNAVSSAYKKYLFSIIDITTHLNPYFDAPYKLWMLLLPDYNPRYESVDSRDQLKYIKQAESIWLKWIRNFCDIEKIELIKKQDDLQKIWSQDKYKNPCRSYEIPYYLAYIYYFHLKDPKTSSDYYKIASANEDWLEWAKLLAAIMKWKWWDREKSFLMFLNMWKSLDQSEDKVCSIYGQTLESLWFQIFRQDKISSSVIKYVSDSRDELFGKFDEEKDLDPKNDNQCSNFLNKAIRELNLYYVENANERYKFDNDWVSASSAKVLYDEKYIDYLPVDYQQYEDYWIIYEYNEDTWFFDYSMGNY